MEFNRENYGKMLDELFARHPSVQKAGFTSGAYKPGLEGMKNFDSELGHPWTRFKSIHVAGTNGKGSVCTMLAAALAANGYRVGLYTSPHLEDFRERAKIIEGGSWRMIPEKYVWDFITGNKLDGLSFFEITTGLAFSWFASQEVDIAVIETGLGGRLDSTNIITPELCIITSIGLDHCSMLGNTRAEIAAEKAGIFKPGVPAVVASRDIETAGVFEQKAAQTHCPLFFADSCKEDDFMLDLHGPYQAANLHTVLFALDLMGEEADKDAIGHAAEITGFRGRWERLTGEPETICDIGHNPAALEINFARLRELGRPLFIVFGIMADKDIHSILPLMPKEAKYFCVAPAIPRALPADKLGRLMEGFDRTVCSSVAEGVRQARLEASGVSGGMVYVGGSNFVVAECIHNLE